jgi:hypothetical protein
LVGWPLGPTRFGTATDHSSFAISCGSAVVIIDRSSPISIASTPIGRHDHCPSIANCVDDTAPALLGYV